MRRIAVIILFCLCFPLLVAAAPQYAKPKAAQAVSNGSIYSLCQDGDGAVWMNTNYGLCRFNGNRLEFVHSQLPRRPISYDSAGNVFVPAFNGILKVPTSGRGSVLVRGEGLKYSESVVLSSPGRLLVGSCNNLFCSNGSDTLLFACSLPEGEKITDLKYSPGGIILASTSSGNLFDVSEFESPLCVYSASDGISAIFADSHKRIWLGLENDGVRVLSSEFYPIRSYTSAGGRQIRNARTFCEDRSGTVYIGSMDGLSLVNPSGECVDSEDYCPAGHAVCQVMTDRENNVWIGTFYDGVFLCEADNSPFRTIPNPNLRLINAMVEDRTGCVWLFTDHYGLWKYTDGAGFSLVPGTLDRKFKSAWYDSRENVIWAGEYFSKLDRIDPVSGRWEEFSCESGIFDIAGRRGDLFLATAGGVYVFDPSSEKAVTRHIEGYSGHTHSVLLDAAGTLWIAGNRLMRYTPSSGIETLPFDARCSDLSCSPDGGICASTIGKGVVLFKDGGTVVLDNSGTGIQDDYTYLVEEVSDGVLLVGTDMGLSLVGVSSGVCCNYNSGNGLSMNSTREGAILHRSNGEIWIGGVDGLVALDRSRISLPAKVNPVCFESVVYGRQGDVTVEVSDFNYSQIVPSLYEYRLDGDASGWTPLGGDQKIEFTGLKPGRHTLEIRAFRFPDLPPSVLEMDVPGKWYTSPWTVALLSAVLAAAAAAAVLRARRMRRLQREREEHQKRVDALIDMTMGLHSPRTKTDKDSEFLLQVASVIEKHLSDEKMSVEMLCSELHLSRTMLDRRIKSLTGNSPRAFIEEIRLTQAARLVRESGLNVSEIAYEMGYSSPKYFSIRFKNRFGMSPLAYRKVK